MSKPTTATRSVVAKRATTTMKKTGSGSKQATAGDAPAQLIDARIKELGDWRGETLARVRMLIKQADPDVVEEWNRSDDVTGAERLDRERQRHERTRDGRRASAAVGLDDVAIDPDGALAERGQRRHRA